jgi:hypothetical protein
VSRLPDNGALQQAGAVSIRARWLSCVSELRGRLTSELSFQRGRRSMEIFDPSSPVNPQNALFCKITQTATICLMPAATPFNSLLQLGFSSWSFELTLVLELLRFQRSGSAVAFAGPQARQGAV